MICDNITNLECAYLIGTQQDIQLMFMLSFLVLAIFMVYKFTPQKIEKLQKFYYTFPITISRYMSIAYLALFPFTLMIYSYNVSYEYSIMWFMLFYMPVLISILFMTFLFAMDKITQWFGFESFYEFYKNTKRRSKE